MSAEEGLQKLILRAPGARKRRGDPVCLTRCVWPGPLFLGGQEGTSQGNWCAHSILVLPGSPGLTWRPGVLGSPLQAGRLKLAWKRQLPGAPGAVPRPQHPQAGSWFGRIFRGGLVCSAPSQPGSITAHCGARADITNQALHTLLQKWLPDLHSTSLQAAEGLMVLAGEVQPTPSLRQPLPQEERVSPPPQNCTHLGVMSPSLILEAQINCPVCSPGGDSCSVLGGQSCWRGDSPAEERWTAGGSQPLPVG